MAVWRSSRYVARMPSKTKQRAAQGTLAGSRPDDRPGGKTRSPIGEVEARRATERGYLLYTPLWVGVVAVVLLSGAFARWRDPEYMLLGLALALPVWLWPAWQERNLPFFRRHGTKTALYITALSFLQNYFGTPFFSRCFGLEYRFPARIALNGYPVFLSLLTVAYFATYFAVMQAGLRVGEPRLPALGRGPWATTLRRVLLTFVLAYSLAYVETLTMATELLRGYFAYADKARMLRVGSLCYGTLLFLAQLVYLRIDADPDRPTPLRRVLWDALAVSMLVLCVYELFAYLLGRWP